MKCFVLLLAIAVCRGFILPYEKVREQKLQPDDVLPTVDDARCPGCKDRFWLDNTFRPFHRSLGLFNRYTKWTMTPEAFMDYVSYRNRPQNLLTHTDVDLKNFWDLVQFPGGDFLLEEIGKYLYPEVDRRLELDLPMDLKFEKYTDILPVIIEKLMQKLPRYTQLVTDTSTLAQLITRDVAKMILEARMHCQYTAVDKNYIDNIEKQLTQVLNEDILEVEEFLMTWLSTIPEYFNTVDRNSRIHQYPSVDMIVYRLTQDLKQRIHKDVKQYVFGIAFKDVAVVVHELYHEIKQRLGNTWTGDEQVFSDILEVVTKIVKPMTCPLPQDLTKKIEIACWDFHNLFVERETVKIFTYIQDLLHMYLDDACSNEDCTQFPRSSETLKIVLKRYFRNVARQLPVCNSELCKTDPTKCLLTYKPTSYPREGDNTQRFAPKQNPWIFKVQDRSE